MKIHTLNTGAGYSIHGQRVAWAELLKETSGSTIVGFYDADRMVHNVVRVTSYPVDDAAVMREYLQCNYVRSFYLPDGVEETLKAAALMHGQNS